MSFRGVPIFTSCFCPQPCPRLSKTGVSIFSLSSCSLISPQFSKKEILLKKKMLKNSSKTSKSYFQKKKTTCFLTMLLDKNFLIGKLLNFCLNLIISPLPYNIPGGVYFFRLVHIKSNIVLIRTVAEFRTPTFVSAPFLVVGLAINNFSIETICHIWV